MNRNENIKKALSEVNIVLENTEEKIKNKIPDKFIKFIQDNMDTNHKIELQKNKPLIEQNIMEETKEILSLIYRDYICTKEEKN